MKIAIWIKDKMDDCPVVKIGSHTWHGEPWQEQLDCYRPTERMPSDDASRILRDLCDKIESQPFCTSRSKHDFTLVNQEAVTSLLDLVSNFLSGCGYSKTEP